MWQDAVLGHLRVLEMSESGMLAPSASGLGVWMVSIQVCKLAVAYMRGVGDDQHRHRMPALYLHIVDSTNITRGNKDRPFGLIGKLHEHWNVV